MQRPFKPFGEDDNENFDLVRYECIILLGSEMNYISMYVVYGGSAL